MSMCRVATVSSLSSYENDINNLMDSYPAAWYLVVVADDVCRSEHWARLRTKFLQTMPDGFKANKPWDYTIR